MTRAAGTPVFSDDTGVRRVTLQVVARGMVGVFALVSVALAVSLVLGVPLPGIDRLVPGQRPGQQHQPTRDAPLAHNRSGNAAGSGALGADGLAGVPTTGVEGLSAVQSRSQEATSTRRQQSATASTGAAVSEPVAEPAPQQSSSHAPAGSPSANPSSQPGNGKPSAKPRNPKAATPARGNSAFSSSRANRATASPDPTQTTPGRSGASHGKSGKAGSG